MALSEREQRLLEEMERSLYQSDADVVGAGRRDGAPSYVSVTFGVLLALVGLGGAIASIAARLPVLGIVGFVVIVLGILLTFRRKREGLPSATQKPASGKRAHGSPVMDAFEDRWERRRERRDQ